MERHTYTINGRVVDRNDKRGVPGIVVEGWDKDLKYDDLLASAITNKEGAFTLHFDSSAFADAYRDTDPDVYFKLFFEGALIASTKDTVIYNFKNQKPEIVIMIASPRRNTGDNYFDRLSKELKSDLDGLVMHEDRILKQLSTPGMAKLFTENPAAALAKMDIAVPVQLRKRLAQSTAATAFLTPRSFRLPNGQLITPKVNVHFTGRKEATNVR